jgi:Tol biopolymer transport system component
MLNKLRTGLLLITLGTAIAPAAVADKDDQNGADLPLQPDRTVSFETDQATWLSLDVAPDGQMLVLEILGDLYLLPMQGGAAKPLTSGMAYDSQPKFSPDGDKVVFVSDRDGNENLWVVDLDGSNEKKLTKGGRRVEFASPSWAPDGQHVVASRTTWGLRTFELWAYHLDGGKGVRITKAKAAKDTPTSQRLNALGAVYGAAGRYLYYARKNGGFGYNVRFPMWQIARRDLETGAEDILTQAQGSAIRPVLSADGRWLVYGTRYEQQTGLRIRDLNSGADRWLAYPVQRDEQESRFTRDLLPGYAFTPDSRAVIYGHGGGVRRVDIASGEISAIPFTAHIEQSLGPRLYFPYRLGVGPVKARMIQDPKLSPDGKRLAFSAFTQLYVHDFATGKSRVISPDGIRAFHPTWSPDGRALGYVSWTSEGGHIWSVRADGRARPRQLTEQAAYYTDPAWSPDGERIVALRANSYERLYREMDFGAPIGSDLVWLPARGGATRLILPSRGYSTPHFGPDQDRIYLYAGNGEAGLVSIRYDGTDRRNELAAKGPGLYNAEEPVAVDDIRLSRDGRHALLSHANQLYVTALLNPHPQNVTVDLKTPALPMARITDVGADYFGWNGEEIYWSVGHRVYRRPLSSVKFDDNDNDNDNDNGEKDGDDGDKVDGEADQEAPAELVEADEAVVSVAIEIYRPRHRPQGVLALVGATLISMAADAQPIADAVVVIENDRIKAAGPRDAVSIPPGATVKDVSGLYVVPGYVDTHAHFRPLRRVLDTENWAFLANLAYGVTSGLDVQPSTTDILAYEDLIDAGLMMGPRALSTGPGIFSNNEFRSAEHTEAVLRRYKDHYRVHNLKAYISGSRQQRQWLVQAAAELKLMPTTEGALDMKLEMTHVIDGFSGNEHNFPVVDLYRDTVELVARSGLAYTPTLLVSYGGPWSENYFYTRESPHNDVKLRRFMPANIIASRTLRRSWVHTDEFVFSQMAAQAAKIVRAGGRVGVGAHGQLQGLGYHWELWALASGMTNLEALTAATRHGAQMIGVAEDIGTVEAGKLADLVLLRANPLQNIRNSAAIEYVIKNGEMYHADSMDKLWPETVPLPPQWWWNTGPNETQASP